MATSNQITDASLTSYCEVLKSLEIPFDVEDEVIIFYFTFNEKISLQLRFALATIEQYLYISVFSGQLVVPEGMRATMAEFIAHVNCEKTIYLGHWNLDYESGFLCYTYNLMNPTTQEEFHTLLRDHILLRTYEIFSTYIEAIFAVLHEAKTVEEALAMLQEEDLEQEEDEENEEDFEEGEDDSDTFLI